MTTTHRVMRHLSGMACLLNEDEISMENKKRYGHATLGNFIAGIALARDQEPSCIIFEYGLFDITTQMEVRFSELQSVKLMSNDLPKTEWTEIRISTGAGSEQSLHYPYSYCTALYGFLNQEMVLARHSARLENP